MQTKARYDLTQGGILQKLVALAVPIMGANLVQMAYNLADMFWLGRLGSGAVAASGTVGIFMWLSMALQHFGSKGAEIGVAQNLGRGEGATARGYGQSAFTLSLILGVLFGGFLLIFRVPLVGFFQIQEAQVVQDAQTYLGIVSCGIPFTYVGAAVMGCFSGSGNTLTPFYISAVCLGLNMVLDPLLIFTAGMGIAGAAVATVAAQALSCILMVLALKRYDHPAFFGFRLFATPRRSHLVRIFRWAAPIAVESFFFTFLVMIVSRFVAAFGAGAIATQRIGSQVESLSWLIAGGFSSAFTAYVGQNYGAGRWRRIHRGFAISTASMVVWGLLVTCLLYFGAGAIFALFLPGEPETVAAGAGYLRILAACQLLGCLEPIAAGAFRGMGRTLPPSLVSILVCGARTIAAWALCQTALGLNGIWWALSLGAAARGLILFVCYLVYAARLPREGATPAIPPAA